MTYTDKAPPSYCNVVACLDLGKHITGVSLWTPWGGLVTASAVRELPHRGEWLPNHMAEAVTAYVRAAYAIHGDTAPFVAYVAEWPQDYRGFRVAKKDLDDLRAVGSILDPYARVTPHEWKGNVPKAIHHNRLRVALTHREGREIWEGLDHNGRDAVGIGLHYFERVDRGGVACS